MSELQAKELDLVVRAERTHQKQGLVNWMLVRQSCASSIDVTRIWYKP